jgi:hypothetical protein
VLGIEPREQAIAGPALASGGWVTGQRIEASGGLRL